MVSNIEEVTAAIRTVPIDRAIPNGMDLIDYLKLMKEMEGGADYAETCEMLGDNVRSHASKMLEGGNICTARTFFLNAVAAYRVGQYTIVKDSQKKIAMYRKLLECYGSVVGLYEPAIERVEIPYKGKMMPGWLRMPAGCEGAVPIVISIGGADGWREEHHNYSDYYSERGIAYLMIDGPGQGEARLFNKLYMELDNELALKEIVEYVSGDVRFGKIGMVGYSFGGYLVARAAAVCDKLDACVVNGGSYYPKEILSFLPHFVNVFSALSNTEGDELDAFVDGMTLEGFADKISCSLLLNHGRPDPLFAASGIERLYAESPSNDKSLKIWDDGNHCVTNHATEVITMIGDWFNQRLR